MSYNLKERGYKAVQKNSSDKGYKYHETQLYQITLSEVVAVTEKYQLEKLLENV